MPNDDADDSDKVTTIKVSQETWQRLTQRKESPSDTYDEIVRELLEEAEEGNPKPRTAATAD